ncbi:MAG: metallophosphoesterase [Rhodomicrobium sp.]
MSSLRVGTGPKAPDGVRIYAVGDIHGRLDLLDRLMDLIAGDSAGRDCARTIVVFLGDYADGRRPQPGNLQRPYRGGLPDGRGAARPPGGAFAAPHLAVRAHLPIRQQSDQKAVIKSKKILTS